jgi:restriction system protein
VLVARRRESLVDVLLVLPWWASVIVAATAFALLKFAAPLFFASSPYTAGIGTLAKNNAAPVAGLFLLIGLLSLVRALYVKRKFNSLASIDHIRELSWRQFESIVGEAFRRRGYTVMENAVDGPDGGIDLVLRKDGAKYYVQCKQWKQSKIGVKPIRELYGVIAAGDAAGGFFVASGEYTSEARDFARKCAIELIDGPTLADMIAKTREPEPFMDPTNRKRVEPLMNDSIANAACPTCGAAMVRRTAKRGTHAGGEFWGCSLYPRCRGTRPA